MGKVIPLQPKIEEKNPHMTGDARCLACKHEWKAVSPIGTLWLECPNCTAEMGRYMAPVHRAETIGGDVVHLSCQCGNDLFFVTPTHIYCPVCGEVMEDL